MDRFRSQAISILIKAGTTVTLLWLSFFAFDQLRHDPLYGYDAPQQVRADEFPEIVRVDGLPYIPLDLEFIPIRGTKCNHEGKPEEVAGTFRVNSVKPGGYTETIGSGSAPRIPGCDTAEFNNPPTEGMIAYVGANNGLASFRYNGDEKPTSGLFPKGKRWNSETFFLYDPERFDPADLEGNT